MAHFLIQEKNFPFSLNLRTISSYSEYIKISEFFISAVWLHSDRETSKYTSSTALHFFIFRKTYRNVYCVLFIAHCTDVLLLEHECC
jgi:hypothetical protein